MRLEDHPVFLEFEPRPLSPLHRLVAEELAALAAVDVVTARVAELTVTAARQPVIDWSDDLATVQAALAVAPAAAELLRHARQELSHRQEAHRRASHAIELAAIELRQHAQVIASLDNAHAWSERDLRKRAEAESGLAEARARWLGRC